MTAIRIEWEGKVHDIALQITFSLMSFSDDFLHLLYNT